MNKLSKAKIKKGKSLLKKMAFNSNKINDTKPKFTPIYDEAYFKGLAIMDGKET